jgi:hypothetical protein
VDARRAPNWVLDPHDLQDRRKPSIPLEEEPAIVVREPRPAGHLAPQNDQLMSERSILSLKPALRLNGEASTARTKQISAIISPI